MIYKIIEIDMGRAEAVMNIYAQDYDVITCNYVGSLRNQIVFKKKPERVKYETDLFAKDAIERAESELREAADVKTAQEPKDKNKGKGKAKVKL